MIFSQVKKIFQFKKDLKTKRAIERNIEIIGKQQIGFLKNNPI